MYSISSFENASEFAPVCTVESVAMHLKSFALLAFAWVPSVFAGPTLYSNSLNSTKPTKGCQQLAAKFPDLVSFPNSTIYDTENQGIPSLMPSGFKDNAHFCHNRILVRVDRSVALVHLHTNRLARCCRSSTDPRSHQHQLCNPWSRAHANPRSRIHQRWRAFRNGQVHNHQTCTVQRADCSRGWMWAALG